MKKKFVGFIAALMVFLVSAPLAKASEPYVSLTGGMGFLTDSEVESGGVTIDDALEYNSGFVVNGAIGFDGGMYRVEAAVGYQRNGIDKVYSIPVPDDWDANVSIWSFMANGYLETEMEGAEVVPYLMAGIGMANVTYDDTFGSSDDSAFAYQFGAGIGVEVSKNVMLDLGYRYFATADVNPDDLGMEFSIASHNVLAGVRIGF